jgi:phosphoribosylformylglycinamidine synthase
MIAMVGLIEDANKAITARFRREGDSIAIVGELAGDLAGSEYLEVRHGHEAGRLRPLEIDRHQPVFEAVRTMIDAGLLASAEDISDGGLLCCAAECCVAGHERWGAALSIPAAEGRVDELLFGEGPARFLVSFAAEQLDEVSRIATERGAPCLVIGRVTRERELVVSVGGRERARVSCEELHRAFSGGFRTVV